MSTFTIFLVLIAIVCFLLVVVIMVQNPKGGGLSSTLGGGGGQIGGVQKTSDFLDKSLFGKLFIDSSLFMSFPLFFFQYVFHNIECVNIANFHNINIENSVI